MRKRIWAVLLTICMLVGLLPTTALAGGVGMDVAYSTYEASKEAAAVSTTSPLHLSDCNFDWPTEEDTLTIKRPILINTGNSWEIPANIHLVFSDSGRIYSVGGADVSLTINGTVTCPSYSFMPTFQLLSSEGTDNALIIGPKAKIEGGFYIDDNITCIVKSGAEVSLDSTVMLGGTLKGEGAKVGTVRVNNGYHTFNGERGTAVLDGTLTVEEMAIYSSVSSSESEKPVYDLIIPSGSQITLGDEAPLVMEQETQLSLEGGLTIGGGYGNSVAGTIAIGESGTLTMPQDSALFGEYVYNSETQESEEVYGQITGTGTIKAYATKNGNVISGVPCVWYTAIPEIVGNRTDNADLVAETVTIWCSWTHNWDEGVVTKEATCTEPGEKTYTCTDDGCGDTMTEVIPVADHTYGEDGICTACGASKSETGAETCSITLNYNETLCTIRVIDGNTQSSENPTVFVTGSGQSASIPSGSWIIFEIFNIQEGYRIGSATLNGTDYTRSFVNGAYGSVGFSDISTDYTLTAVMEEIPDTLPSVTSVTLYTDLAGTQPAAANITYTSESTDARLYGKATFSDNVEHPVYYARGQWQFSTDGITWQNTACWGSNRFDFWPGWPYHEELDFLTASYDIRLKVIPQDLYTTGEAVYSNVTHINGGANSTGGTEEEQYSVSNIRFSAAGADHPLLVWDCTPAEDVTCSVYVTYDSGAAWELFESEIADAVCDIMEPGMDGVNGIKIEMADANGTVKATATDMNIQISAEGTTELKDLTGTVSDAGDDKNFSWTISGFSENTLVWVNFTDADGSLRSGLANVSTGADGSLSGKTPYGLIDHVTDNIYIGEAYEYGEITVQDEGKTLSYTMTMVGENVKLTAEPCEEHTFGEWSVTKEATCTETGAEKRTCTVCGETETREIEALGGDHIWSPNDCTEKATCTRCGATREAGEHAWGEWVVDKEATGTEDGSRHRDCSRCDAVDTEVISMLQKQEVSWFPAGPITWTYGQVNTAQNTAYNDTEDGGELTYSSSDESVATVDADGKATIVGAGTVQITATAAAVPGQYAETSASYTLIINKAPLTVTANDHTITYGQAPVGNGWTASGFQYNDTQSVVTGTAAYTYTYEQYGNVGPYAINVSGLTAKNYDITFVPGTLTVSKATDYTITLDKLTQRDDDITAVTASIAPQDATAEITVEYQLADNTWTTSLPAAAGEYPVRASLTGSSNIQTNGAYTYGTLTIQRSIGVDGTDVTVTVDEGKANITVTEDELADIVNKADGDVSVNLGGVEGVDQLVLPGSLLEALSESDSADSLTITTEDASISMSGAVLDTVASAVTGDKDTVTVKLTSVEEDDLTELQQKALSSITQDAVIVEVSLVITHADGSPDTELHQLGGNVEVAVPYAGEVPEGKYIVVCYLSDDGNVTYVRATYNADTQQVTFTTNHFSNYAVFVSADPAVMVNGGSGSGIYAEGTTVTIKADSKSGYTFAGWKIVSGDVTLTNAKTAETTFEMPATNVELTATYTKNTSGGSGGVSTYTLTFETNGGSAIASVSKASGTTIDLTGYVPARAGYDFDGWYADAGLTDKITSVKLTKNMTVYAKWTEKDGEPPFTDVSGDAYYADAVIWAVGKGITSGTTATTFAPDNPCTRAQAVTFLWRAAGSPVVNYAMNFSDVSADAYYAEAVRWAVSQGITMGTSDTAFSPNAPCTRAQIVTFLWRSQQSPAAEGVNPFTDVAADAYYASAVLWAAENGITSGTTATTFSPDATCTRAQIVTFLYRAFAD